MQKEQAEDDSGVMTSPKTYCKLSELTRGELQLHLTFNVGDDILDLVYCVYSMLLFLFLLYKYKHKIKLYKGLWNSKTLIFKKLLFEIKMDKYIKIKS